MRKRSVPTANAVCTLLDNYSIEMTAKDVPHLEAAADVIPQGTKIPVTFLPGEDFPMRIAAARRVRELGDDGEVMPTLQNSRLLLALGLP